MGLFGKRMKDPVQGRAEVVIAVGPLPGAAGEMQLIVTAEGVEPTQVSYSGRKHGDRWPLDGDSIPVTVDRANPQDFRIEWSQLPDRADRIKRDAQHIASDRVAEMHGEGEAADEIEQARQDWRENLEQEICTQEEFDDEMRRLDEAARGTRGP
jgi:hypothetical protein